MRNYAVMELKTKEAMGDHEQKKAPEGAKEGRVTFLRW
jgi:hypothetical protein